MKRRFGILEAERETWVDHFEELSIMVEQTPEIVITKDSLSFYDTEAKAAFHRALDGVIKALIRGFAAAKLDAICQEAFRQVETSLCGKSGIEGIMLPKSLQDYRDNPVRTASKILFDPSIKLLQQRITRSELEQFAQANVPAYLANMNDYLYEAWIAYGLLDMLDPVEFRNVTIMSDGSLAVKAADYLKTGYQVPSSDLRLPEAILVSSSGDCYAYKFEHVTEIVSYKIPCRARDFTSAGNTAGQACKRVMILYRIANPDTVPIIAQRSKKSMLPPDLMVEHLSATEYASLEKRQEVRSRAEIADPHVPTQVVLFDERPGVELVASDQGARAFDTHIVGYDKTRLAAVIEPLFTAQYQLS
jgi:hypothetical protein